MIAQGEQRSILVKRCLDIMSIIFAMWPALQPLAAILGPFHRSASHHSEHDGDHLRVDLHFVTETPTKISNQNPHVRLRQIERQRHQAAHLMRNLG